MRRPRILAAAQFGRDEIEALGRWRTRLVARLPKIAGRTLRCVCRRGDPWCHIGSLAAAASGLGHGGKVPS